MGSDVEKRLGRQVAAYRKSAALTQEALAERVKVTPETISRLERGSTVPGLATIENVARALNVELRDLFDFRAGRTSKDQAISDILRKLQRGTASDIKLVGDLADAVFEYGGRQ